MSTYSAPSALTHPWPTPDPGCDFQWAPQEVLPRANTDIEHLRQAIQDGFRLNPRVPRGGTPNQEESPDSPVYVPWSPPLSEGMLSSGEEEINQLIELAIHNATLNTIIDFADDETSSKDPQAIVETTWGGAMTQEELDKAWNIEGTLPPFLEVCGILNTHDQQSIN